MPANYITLTRQALYELVWSKPMSSLAKEFGISDVALAKRCRAVDVPVPPRGWWARQKAGQNPPRTPFPRYRRSEASIGAADESPRAPKTTLPPVVRDGPEPSVNFGRPPPGTFSPPDVDAPVSAEEQAFRERLARHATSPAPDLSSTCAAVRRAARQQKLPGTAGLPMSRGERSGPVPNLHVTPTSLKRALLFADVLIRSAEGLGWHLTALTAPAEPERSRWAPPKTQPRQKVTPGLLSVDGVDIEFVIEERMRDVTPAARSSSERRRANQYSPSGKRYEGTGRLRLACLAPREYGDPRRSWGDRGDTVLEDKLQDILWYFQQLAAKTLERRADAAKAELRRQQRERRELELSIQRGHHAKLVEALESQAGSWYRATFLRRYLRALRRHVGEGRLEGKLGEQKVDFLLWAEKYVDQLDPFNPTPRVEEMMPPDSWNYTSDTELRSQLARLLGRHWHVTHKMLPGDGAS